MNIVTLALFVLVGQFLIVIMTFTVFSLVERHMGSYRGAAMFSGELV